MDHSACYQRDLEVVSIRHEIKRRNGPSAIWKSLQVLLDLAVSKTHVEFNGESTLYMPPSRVGLSPNLWRKDDCYRCGRSCRGFALVFLPGEQAYSSVRRKGKTIDMWINGKRKQVLFYKQMHTRGDEGCDFLKGEIGIRNGCKCIIQSQKPLHCKLPHIRIQRNRMHDSAIIMRTQYGRNWAMGCPVKLKNKIGPARFNQDRLTFVLMLHVADSLGLKTKLPEIISLHERQGIKAPSEVTYV